MYGVSNSGTLLTRYSKVVIGIIDKIVHWYYSWSDEYQHITTSSPCKVQSVASCQLPLATCHIDGAEKRFEVSHLPILHPGELYLVSSPPTEYGSYQSHPDCCSGVKLSNCIHCIVLELSTSRLEILSNLASNKCLCVKNSWHLKWFLQPLLIPTYLLFDHWLMS